MVNVGCFFDALDQITIGDLCSVGMQVLFCTSTHELDPTSRRRAGASRHAPVVVGDGVWIGGRSMILPGVTIANGCVIAAGSVVTADTEPDGLYAGNPARRVKDLPTDQSSSGGLAAVASEL
jgi:maltose O-acetyltransferase